MLLEDEIRNETNRLAELRTQIRQTIDSVPNTDERLVLRYRYLQSLTWEEIAMRMHACRMSVIRWHKKACRRCRLYQNQLKYKKSWYVLLLFGTVWLRFGMLFWQNHCAKI